MSNGETLGGITSKGVLDASKLQYNDSVYGFRESYLNNSCNELFDLEEEKCNIIPGVIAPFLCMKWNNDDNMEESEMQARRAEAITCLARIRRKKSCMRTNTSI